MRPLIQVLVGLLLVSAFSATAHDVSVSCMMAYEEGGLLAVFESPECPQWVLYPQVLRNQTRNCQYHTRQGRRNHQEDRVTCNTELPIPVLDDGEHGLKEAKLGVFAIFDGHGGKEASVMASKKLLDYFLLHLVFGTYNHSFLSKNDHDIYGLLKEALLKAIHDIDTIFSLDAMKNNYSSGTTATVVLLLDGNYLVANVGDSKALMCSYEDSSMRELSAKELTRDHHPDRKDEKARIEAAGGFVVVVWGVARINTGLAMSRSIGDLPSKRYGVIATPEVLDWQPLKDEDRYLVVASDGIFESLHLQDVCNLLENSRCSSSSSLAACVVNTAYDNRSKDNLSAIVVPLATGG